jgi:hypothetical protein
VLASILEAESAMRGAAGHPALERLTD